MKKVFIKTFGCQMNVYDSEYISFLLKNRGFKVVDKPEEADFIVVNGCVVRAKPAQKAFSFAKQWAKKGKKIISVGCFAKFFEKQLEKFSSLIISPKNYNVFEKIDFDNLNTSKVLKYTSDFADGEYGYYKRKEKVKHSEYITIVEGCDNFCSYCIVPFVRGREVYRSVYEIVDEIEYLISKGVKEIILIGQNVNVYYHNGYDFKKLLLFILKKVKNLKRLGFTTLHPRDVDYELIKIVSEEEKLLKWFHLPFQTGSNKLLIKMRRGYLKEEYLEKVMYIREKIPDAVISTDIMVGLPFEDEKDFEDTLDIVNKVKFENAFMFVYTPRDYTYAGKFWKKYIPPPDVVQRRLRTLIKNVTKNAFERKINFIDKEMCLMYDGGGEGRGWNNLRVKILSKEIENLKPGTFIKCKIENLQGLLPYCKSFEIIS
ncbi:tRNA (N6-isopentenyl adenosine(37)-C2)-methylthiotransferase MiaB [Candidatus Pacearchaeota archaeon]|nr:MAG: tRNA (N6-isopentenyl adenosine(37)-C2)-methylthiotransferase MiaB [Candidatus Pacearchaeota archaeon]